jgi:DNA-binding NarL/FixJ family response regulator
MSVKLIILSDIRLYREGLALNITSRGTEVEVVATCANAREALRAIEQSAGAVVLIDAGMADTLSEVRQLGMNAPETRILALAMAPDTDDEILEAAEAGISGYVPPEAGVDELIASVEHAARGEILCSPRMAGTLARRVASLAAIPAAPTPTSTLTAREQEVLALLNIGLSNKQIARQLSIRLATVKNHVHSILAKLNVKRRGEAVAATSGRIRTSAPNGAPPTAWRS